MLVGGPAALAYLFLKHARTAFGHPGTPKYRVRRPATPVSKMEEAYFFVSEYHDAPGHNREIAAASSATICRTPPGSISHHGPRWPAVKRHRPFRRIAWMWPTDQDVESQQDPAQQGFALQTPPRHAELLRSRLNGPTNPQQTQVKNQHRHRHDDDDQPDQNHDHWRRDGHHSAQDCDHKHGTAHP